MTTPHDGHGPDFSHSRSWVDNSAPSACFAPRLTISRHYNNMLISSADQEVFCHPSDYGHALPLAEHYVGVPLMHVRGSLVVHS